MVFTTFSLIVACNGKFTHSELRSRIQVAS